MSDWLSDCCDAEPDDTFSTYGEDVGMPSGVCSNCLEHCDLHYQEDDDEE